MNHLHAGGRDRRWAWVTSVLAWDRKLCTLEKLITKLASWLSCDGQSRGAKMLVLLKHQGWKGTWISSGLTPSSLQDLEQYLYYLFLGFISSLKLG